MYCPGAVPFGLASTVPALDHLRLTAVDVGHLQTAPREPRGDVLDQLPLLDQGPPDDGGDRVARQVVVGRTQAAGHHDQVHARQRLPHQVGDQLPIVADHGFRAQLDADRRTAVRR